MGIRVTPRSVGGYRYCRSVSRLAPRPRQPPDHGSTRSPSAVTSTTACARSTTASRRTTSAGSSADRSLPRRSAPERSAPANSAPERSRSRSEAPAQRAPVRSASRIRTPLNRALASSAAARPTNDQSPPVTVTSPNEHRSNRLPTSLHRSNSASKNEQPVNVELRKAASVCREPLNRQSWNAQSVNMAPSPVTSDRSTPLNTVAAYSRPERSSPYQSSPRTSSIGSGLRGERSDARQVPHVRAAQHLARVEQALRIEGGLDRAVHVQRHGPDLALQPVDLDRADPVLASDRAAQREPELQDVVEGAEGPGPLVGVGRVEADGRVHVAVAGVADDADRQLPGGGDGVAAVEEGRDPRPRDGDVVDERAAQLLQRRQGHAPRGEQQVALGGVVGGVHEVGAGLAAQLRERLDLPCGRLAARVGLRHQQRARPAVEVGVQQ